jgi:hypothetical protein
VALFLVLGLLIRKLKIAKLGNYPAKEYEKVFILNNLVINDHPLFYITHLYMLSSILNSSINF